MSVLKKAISCGDEITLKNVRFKGSIISGQTSIPLNHNVLQLVYKNLSKILHAMKLWNYLKVKKLGIGINF